METGHRSREDQAGHLTMHSLLVAIVAIAVELAAAPVHAHGDWPPKHGGLMNEGGETSFELVARGTKVILYVEDHGTPVSTQGAKGTLTVTRGSETWSGEITRLGDNRLESRLTRPLARGDRVLAKVTMGNGSIAAGRFVIK
jgi:hypothetical protein